MRTNLKAAPGDVWEGSTKHGPVTRRRVLAVTEAGVEWEPVGTPPRGAREQTMTWSSWQSWAKRLLRGVK